jgi:hypothetical protein
MAHRLRRSFEQIRAALDVAGEATRERSGKGRARQALELLWFRARGYTPDDYYTLRLYAPMPLAANAPMRRREFSRLRRLLNPQQAEVVPFNKWVAALYFETLGLRVPACHGYYHRCRGMRRDGRRLVGAVDLAALLSELPGGVAIKPIDASHGRDVTIIVAYDAASGRLTRANGRVLPLPAFAATLDASDEGWVVQERIVQHPVLAALHPQSANTVRVVSLTGEGGVPAPVAAVLRIGTGGAEIDNTTGGGIVAPIELATGRCGKAISRYRVTEHTRHPDTGALIEGLVVPYWPQVLALVVRAHALLPFPRTLGWDIALDEREPVLLELNSDYYHNHLQLDGAGEALAQLRAFDPAQSR